MKKYPVSTRGVLLALAVSSGIAVFSAGAQNSASPTKPQTASPVAKHAVTSKPTHYMPERFSRRAQLHYSLVWGVDSLNVKTVESGEVVRFTFRVVDPNKAKMLNDKKYQPFLIDPGAGVRLIIPSLEKVGQLRQTSIPEVGKTYWMAFSNKGRRVRPGDRVNVVIGDFHADGLVVD
jgi:hypothetical protein